MFIKLLLALTIALAAALPARAKAPVGMWEPADKLIPEALETAYARALLNTFAASVRKDGDRSCLQAKALDDAALVPRGRALFQRYGVRMMKILEENFDGSAFQSALSASAGPNALAEFERLKRSRDVKKLIELYRPVQLAEVIDIMMEHFDRYVLIRRIKLDPVSPIARGESEDNPTEAMRANPTQATEAAVQRFLDEHPSPQIDRYLTLYDAVQAARRKGFSTPAALKVGLTAYYDGVERDLADLCVGRR